MAMYGSNLWCYVIFVFRANFSKAIIFSFVEDIHLPENYKLKVVEEIYQEQCVYENQYTQGIRKENGIHFEQQIIILQTFFFFIWFFFFGGGGGLLLADFVLDVLLLVVCVSMYLLGCPRCKPGDQPI